MICQCYDNHLQNEFVSYIFVYLCASLRQITLQNCVFCYILAIISYTCSSVVQYNVWTSWCLWKVELFVNIHFTIFFVQGIIGLETEYGTLHIKVNAPVHMSEIKLVRVYVWRCNGNPFPIIISLVVKTHIIHCSVSNLVNFGSISHFHKVQFIAQCTKYLFGLWTALYMSLKISERMGFWFFSLWGRTWCSF